MLFETNDTFKIIAKYSRGIWVKRARRDIEQWRGERKRVPHYWPSVVGNPAVTDAFSSQRASYADLFMFPLSADLPVIWDALGLIWRHCNDRTLSISTDF